LRNIGELRTEGRERRAALGGRGERDARGGLRRQLRREGAEQEDNECGMNLGNASPESSQHGAVIMILGRLKTLFPKIS
jgi:hypothetical protein